MTGASTVTMRIWRVPATAVPGAIARVGAQRRRLRHVPGLTFAKQLGTGSGQSFTLRDAELRRWALLTVFADAAAAGRFDDSEIVHAWRQAAEEELRLELAPLSSRGSWAGQDPFAAPPPKHRWEGPTAALTRARIRPGQWRRFWASVPPVAADLRERAGLEVSLGIGEAPVGLQGTFSVWRSNRELTEFAQRGAAHRAVVDETARRQWYAEELFARFAVLGVAGTFDGRTIGGTPRHGS